MAISNVNNNDNINAVTGTGSASAASASSKTENNSILTNKKPKEELLKQLGLTVEQYLEICNNNPNFETLPLEKQLEYLSKQNVRKTGQAQTTQNAQSVENQTEATTSQSVESPDAQSAASEPQTPAEESPFFNKAEFSELPTNKKMNVYVEQYAKNAFMFADNENPKTPEEWDALSEEEKLQHINTAGTQLKEKFSSILKLTSKELVDIALDGMMTNLLAANFSQMRVSQFGGLTQEQRDDAVYSYLNEVELIETDMNCQSTMSEQDKARLEKQRLLARAVEAHSNGKLENICPDDAQRYLKVNNLTEFDVELAYLNNKKENSSLTKFEQDRLQELNGLMENKSFKLALKDSKYQGLQNLKAERAERLEKNPNADVSDLDKIINSPESQAIDKWGQERNKVTIESPQEFDDFKASEYGQLYAANSDPHIRAAVLIEYINKNIKPEERADVAAKLSQGLEAEGPEAITTNIKFIQYGLQAKDKGMASKVAEDANIYAVNIAKDENTKEGIDTPAKVHSAINKRNLDEFLSAKNEDIRREARQIILTSATVEEKYGNDKSKLRTVEDYAELSGDKDIGTQLINTTNSIDDAKAQRNGFNKILPNASDEVKTYGAVNSYKAHEENQNFVLDKFTEDCEAAVRAVNEEGTFTKLASKNQVKAMNLINQRIDDYFEGQEKIDMLKLSADHIADAAVENQLEMHKSVMQSGYDEVLEHASSNINKYHESVQADAIRASYETGNQKAIDAVNSQLDLCSKSAVDSVAEVNAMLASSEQSSNEQVLQMVSQLNSDYKTITGNDIEVYGSDGSLSNIVEEFKIAMEQNDTHKQIQLLGKIPSNMLSSAISQMSMYNVNLLSTFVRLGRGQELLRIPGMSNDITSKVIHLMLNSSLKDQKFAAKYVIENKNYFSKSTLERCQELLSSSKKSYSSAPMGGVKMALQPTMSAIYPGKKEMFYNA